MGEMKGSLKNDVEKTKFSPAKDKLDLYLTPYTKINSK